MIKFKKGQKVWCTARVSFFLPYRHTMCGKIVYRLPKYLKWFVAWLIIYETKGDFYLVKMEDGTTVFYSEENITELSLAIKQMSFWVGEIPADPVQIPYFYNLKRCYQDMIYFSET